MSLLRYAVIVLLLSAGAPAAGAVQADEPPPSPSELLKRELQRRYPGARIEVIGQPRWVHGAGPADVYAVSVLEDSPRGDVHFSAQTRAKTSHEGWISFAAWVPAHVAARRIHPGERLSRELFIAQDVNVATGQAREYRGVLLPPETEIGGLEARQSILEGQFAVMTAVQRVPDIRRGDSVKVVLTSGELSLTTTGVATEPAYNEGPVRITTHKNKRELTGRLTPGGVVEVQL